MSHQVTRIVRLGILSCALILASCASGPRIITNSDPSADWSGWSAGVSTTEVVQRTEGTLAVDIVDRARNQLVWEGAASKRVTDSTRQNQDQVLDDAIADIFAQFP